MKNKVIIRGDFFPIHFRLLGTVLLIAAFITTSGGYSASIPITLFIVSSTLLFSRMGTVVNKKKRTIKKYLALFFIVRVGKNVKYDLLTCFWLKSHKMQTVWQNQAVSYTSPEYGVFDVYLVSSDGVNQYLFEDRSKQGVYRRLTKAMQLLNIKCLDKKS